MVWQVYFPQSPQLHRLIECFWYIDEQIAYNRERILPTSTVELIINFGDVFHVRESEDSDNYRVNRDAWIVGIHNRAIISDITGQSHMIGVRFRPAGASPFLACHAHEIHNDTVEMELIWGREIKLWREQLYHAPSITARFQLLETLLCQRLQQIDDHHQLVTYAVGSLARQCGDVSIKALAEQIGISQKHLGHQFKKMVGVTPKHLAKIYRFQQVLQSIQIGEAIDWTDIAYHCQYHDQSHFNKDFAQFTGLTPSRYVTLLQPYVVAGEDSRHFVPIG